MALWRFSGETLKSVLQILLPLVFLLPTKAEPVQKVIICFDSWSPAMIPPGDGNQSRHGFLVDMFADIYSAHGYQVSFKRMPYLRSVREVEIGNCDMSPSATREVSEKVLFSKSPSYISNYVFFSRRSFPFKYSGVGSLEKVLVGNVTGYDYSSIDKAFQEYLSRKNNKMVSTVAGDAAVDRIFRLIAVGRVDAFCEDSNVGSYIVGNMGLADKFKIAGEIPTKLNLYAIFSPKDPSKSHGLIQLYQEALEKNRDLLKSYIKDYSIKLISR